MSTVHLAVSDMLVTVKSREIQRGMLAEMHKDREAATRHYLAAAHLELVLATDYAEAGQDDMARRSRLSAASCLWRAGRIDEAKTLVDGIIRDYPACAEEIEQTLTELQAAYPGESSTD